MTTKSSFADYLDTEIEFRAAESGGSLAPAREDELTDRLARLWWKLTDEEQRMIEEISKADSVAALAVDVFDLVDRPVGKHERIAPRKAA